MNLYYESSFFLKPQGLKPIGTNWTSTIKSYNHERQRLATFEWSDDI